MICDAAPARREQMNPGCFVEVHMRLPSSFVMVGLSGRVAFVIWTTLSDRPDGIVTAVTAADEDSARRSGFEVWIADQSDTRRAESGQTYGGQVLIYEGSDLLGRHAAQAQPIRRVDLGEDTAELCVQQTGRFPVRPHMMLFNNDHTHAIFSFVASGHVVVFDAQHRRPLSCLEMTVGSTGTRQAHAAFAAPDGSYIVVANQNGKRLERIDTDFDTNTFVHNPEATLDLMTCTTPSGLPCESQDLRPVNWPICPILDASSRYAFVTLRGGGLFVVDARATPMAIVGEYDQHTVRGNGCGGLEVGQHMYINSGGSSVNIFGTDPHHPSLYGFDVYRFPLSGYSADNPPNTPAPTLVYTKGGAADSHGLALPGRGRFLWAMDRHNDVAEILDLRSARHVNTVHLNGVLTDNAAPDLIDVAPFGNRMFVALRGPTPLSGDPHNAIGSTPGLGVIEVNRGGRSGRLAAIVPLTNPLQQPGQSPDPHGLRVRLRH
jgi:hypothetical protein